MPTSYTSLLGLALPVTGELSGTWGDTVNDYITQYLDASVAGTQTISGSQTAVTLSKTTATSLSQAGSGATGSSQYMIINCTGNPASLLTITAPAASKPYIVINGTSTSQQVKLVGAGPTTGVTLESGERAVVAWNGSDFVKIATSTADGVTTFSAGTTGFTPSSATSGAVTLAGTLATTNGGTGLTSFTANGVVYASSSSALTTGSALAFDGTNLGIGTSSPSAKLDVRGNATFTGNATARQTADFTNTGGQLFVGSESSSGGAVFTGSSAYAGVVGTNTNTVLQLATNGTVRATLDSSGNLGIGTSSPGVRLDVSTSASTALRVSSSNALGTAISFRQSTNQFCVFGATSSITGSGTNYTPILFAETGLGINFATNGSATIRMNLDTSGNLGVGTTVPSTYGRIVSASGIISLVTDTASERRLSFWSTANGNSENGYIQVQNDGVTTNTGEMLFATKNTGGTLAEKLRITATGFTRPVAYADTVSALGNTGTATTINLQNANVFTATLTGNCTFTLSNPIATGSSSFTLILTNDGTAGRTVAWAGGSFVFPGGAASLSRTTTANAVDVWVFFTPNGGTTWYGNIAMKDMKA